MLVNLDVKSDYDQTHMSFKIEDGTASQPPVRFVALELNLISDVYVSPMFFI